MALYRWNTKLHNILKKYFPKFWLKKIHRYSSFGKIREVPLTELNTYVRNTDLYPVGIQVVLNLGAIEIDDFPGGDYGILPHPVEDGKHLREYESGPIEGHCGYFYPFKRRTLIFA